ncbi:MAG: trypsin-like peptidase domain-containing protein [Burkholderiales bacterium]|nr:trypsin-like peptidase domain-containing protein [Burkholderiales bacterium]
MRRLSRVHGRGLAWQARCRLEALPGGALLLALTVFATTPVLGAQAVPALEKVKQSVVGLGTFMATRTPPLTFVGTGFIVADGRHVVTNAHVVQAPLDTSRMESRIVLVSRAGEPVSRRAELIALDKDHDLAVLRFTGEQLPALRIGDSDRISEGQLLAFTGFPIGMVLGFHPATHRAMVSAITPVAVPGITARQLNERMISRLRDSAYRVFQLDATAYPGNSGSPLYDPEDGSVYGIINSVFVQGTRESAISRPSGITYAIPGRHIREILRAAKVAGFD